MKSKRFTTNLYKHVKKHILKETSQKVTVT